jgi:hypothetical protein
VAIDTDALDYVLPLSEIAPAGVAVVRCTLEDINIQPLVQSNDLEEREDEPSALPTFLIAHQTLRSRRVRKLSLRLSL